MFLCGYGCVLAPHTHCTPTIISMYVCPTFVPWFLVCALLSLPRSRSVLGAVRRIDDLRPGSTPVEAREGMARASATTGQPLGRAPCRARAARACASLQRAARALDAWRTASPAWRSLYARVGAGCERGRSHLDARHSCSSAAKLTDGPAQFFGTARVSSGAAAAQAASSGLRAQRCGQRHTTRQATQGLSRSVRLQRKSHNTCPTQRRGDWRALSLC